MKTRLTRPLPQVGRVIPAGVVLDAPEGLSGRLIREGGAEPAERAQIVPGPVPAQETAVLKRKGRGKRA